MRSDILEDYTFGKSPKEVIKEKKVNPKTAYYYHSMYNQLKEIVVSEEFINQIIRLLLKMRIKEK